MTAASLVTVRRESVPDEVTILGVVARKQPKLRWLISDNYFTEWHEQTAPAVSASPHDDAGESCGWGVCIEIGGLQCSAIRPTLAEAIAAAEAKARNGMALAAAVSR